MYFNIEGIIDNMSLYKKQKNVELIDNSNIIKRKLKEYGHIIVNYITIIAEKLDYYIEQNLSNKIIIKRKQNEKVIFYYNFREEKVNTTYFINISINIECNEISPELLLLIDYIYTYFENNTQLYRRWKVSYMGNTNNNYIIRDDLVKIYANSIILSYKPRKDKKMGINDFLKEVLVKELKKAEIYRSYIKKKVILNELEKQKEIIYKIPIHVHPKEKFRYKKKEIIFKTSVINYKEIILKREKVGTINTILEEESIKISNRKIKNAKIYKVANVSKKRQKKCYLYYIVDILYKYNAVNKDNRLYGDHEPYLRLYLKEKPNKQEVLDIIKYLQDNKMEIKW